MNEIYLPLLTAVITFALTSIFTVYREKKNVNILNRVFIKHEHYFLNYPFDKEKIEIFGKGKILLSENGEKLHSFAKKEEDGCNYEFLILKNITTNDIHNANVKICVSCYDKILKEEYSLPVWNHSETLYIPTTIFEGSVNFSTSENFSITYKTASFEKFKLSYKKTKKGEYIEKLQKKYLFFWITKTKTKYKKFQRAVTLR